MRTQTHGSVIYVALVMAGIAAIVTTPAVRTAAVTAVQDQAFVEAVEDVGHMIDESEFFGRMR